jgi:hypothetical protein
LDNRKTICAEAVASALDRGLLRVRYTAIRIHVDGHEWCSKGGNRSHPTLTIRAQIRITGGRKASSITPARWSFDA